MPDRRSVLGLAAGKAVTMRTFFILGITLVFCIGIAAPALSDDEYWDGPCQVKTESKQGEFKREVKCKDGVGSRWRGEWKKEYWDGPCKVKIEAKRDEFKEEAKCE